MGKAVSKGIQTKYQSNSPGRYWIKISDANKLREKALKELQKKLNSQISERLTKLEVENRELKSQLKW